MTAGKPRRENRYVLIGTVTKPHGIRGEFSIRSYADSPCVFDVLPAFYLAPKDREPGRNAVPYHVRKWRMHKEQILMTAKEVPDRNASELLRGMDVFALHDDLPEPDEGEFYMTDLLDCTVVLEDNTEVGVFTHFIETPGQDTWVITTPDDKEVMLPAVPEFIADIDLDEEIIVITPPEGLLDIYLSEDTAEKD